MGQIIGGLIIIGFLVLTVLMCRQESQKKKINFWLALLICFAATPIFGYFIVSSFPVRNPIGCKWCGNTENEVEFCGICGKNDEGKSVNASDKEDEYFKSLIHRS